MFFLCLICLYERSRPGSICFCDLVTLLASGRPIFGSSDLRPHIHIQEHPFTFIFTFTFLFWAAASYSYSTPIHFYFDTFHFPTLTCSLIFKFNTRSNFVFTFHFHFLLLMWDLIFIFNTRSRLFQHFSLSLPSFWPATLHSYSTSIHFHINTFHSHFLLLICDLLFIFNTYSLYFQHF